MTKSFRSLARISSLSLILAFTTLALPQAQNAHAYVQDITYTGPGTNGTSVTEGDTYTGQLGTFSDNCLDVSNFNGTVDWGDGHTDTAKVLNQGSSALPGLCQFGVFDTHVYQEEGQETIVVSVKNLQDGSVEHISGIVNVADAPLTPSNAQTFSPTEGQQFVAQFLGNFTDGNQPVDPNPNATPRTICGSNSKEFTVSIDWGDNTPETSGIITPDNNTVCMYGVTGSHTYAQEGKYSVTVTVTDHDSTAVINAIADVGDASLEMVTPTGINVFEGAGFTNHYLGTFHDLNPNCEVGDYSVSIDWQDPAAPDPDISTPSVKPNTSAGPCRFDVFGSHNYTEEGTYSPVVTITDHAASVQLIDTINVADQVIQSVAHADFKAVEGMPIGNPDPNGQLIGTIHDLNPACDGNDFVISANWGDGTGLDTTSTDFTVLPDANPAHAGNCNFLVYGKHTYLEQNLAGYPVSVTVQDGTVGKKVVLAEHAIVSDAPLSTVAGTTFTQIEGQQFTHYVGTFHDPAGDFTIPTACDIADYTAVIDWGDGSTSTVTSVTDASTVGNIIAADPANGNSGLCNFDVVGVHTYHEENPNPGLDPNPATNGYPVSVTVTDTPFDKTIINSTANINVQDAVLTNVTNGGTLDNLQQTEGMPFANYYLGSFNDAAFTDATHTDCDSKDYSVLVDWGDGGVNPHGSVTTTVTSTQTAAGIIKLADGTAGPAGTCNFDIFGSYNYLEESYPGTFTVNITVTDNGKPDPSMTPQHPTVSWSDTMNVLDAPFINPPGKYNNITFRPIEGKADNHQYLGTVIDTDPGCNVADLNSTPGSIRIDWGDGTPVDDNGAGGTGVAVLVSQQNVTSCAIDIFGSHNYAEDSTSADSHPYKVHVDITDNPSAATLDDVANVIDAPLTTLAQPKPVYTEGILDVAGSVADVSKLHYLGTIHDTAGDTLGNDVCDLAGGDYTAVVKWGDGSQDTFTKDLLNSATTSGVIVPAAAGNGHAGVCNFDILGSHLYKEETEPKIFQKIQITFTDEGHQAGDYATTTLLDLATVNDAPLVAKVNTVTPAGCTLLTACTVQVATFLDTSTSCNAEGENLTTEPLHYTATINWGDGSKLDKKVVVTADKSAPCTFDITGTHIFASPGSGANGGPTGTPFNVTTTIVDEGEQSVTTSLANGTSTKVPVTIPASNPTSGLTTIAFAYPQGLTTPTYFLNMAAFHNWPAKSNPEWNGYLGFYDKQMGVTTPSDKGVYIGTDPKGTCQTVAFQAHQCKLRFLSMVIKKLSPQLKDSTVWASFSFWSDGSDGLAPGTVQTRYVKVHSQQGPTNSNQFEFDVTASPATHPFDAVVSNEPRIPINAINIQTR